ALPPFRVSRDERGGAARLSDAARARHAAERRRDDANARRTLRFPRLSRIRTKARRALRAQSMRSPHARCARCPPGGGPVSASLHRLLVHGVRVSAPCPRSRPAPSGLGFAPLAWTSRGGPSRLED